MGIAYQIAQLRHAYMQLKQGTVRDQARFADGLIAPAISAIEMWFDQQGIPINPDVTESSGCVFNDLAILCRAPGCRICGTNP